MKVISLIYKRFSLRIIFTYTILVLESIAMLLFPLFIGKAISSMLDSSFSGLIALAILTLCTLVLGSSRRFFDTRLYSKIFSILGTELHQGRKDLHTSTLSARISMLSEAVSFLENSLPLLLNHLIGLLGTLLILANLNLQISGLALLSLGIIIAIYMISSKRIIKFNSKYNDELENQVNALDSNESHIPTKHFLKLMNWKIRLSDLETWNYSLIWLFLSGLLILSIVLSKNTGIEIGIIISTVMYVFQFMESALNLPYYYQETLRLQDISKRLLSILKHQS